MAKTFRLELLPALHGDCIWVEYGDSAARRRILIDGGPIGAYADLFARIEQLPPAERTFELLVVTHVDADHIEGAIRLLNDAKLGVRFKDIWFNGWAQFRKPLPSAAPPAARQRTDRSPAQGGMLATRLEDRGEPWNKRFRGRAAYVRDDGPLPRIPLDGGMTLTLLGPTAEKLKVLRTAWKRAIERLGTTPDDTDYFRRRLDRDKRFRGAKADEPAWDELPYADRLAGKIDRAVANGSSIAFVAEYEGKRCALLGDAHMPEIESGVARLARELGEPRLRLDAVKLAHHGSSGNISRSFLQKISCDTYLVSTDGSIFDHPDDAAIEQIVLDASKPIRLVFNYLSERNKRWAEGAVQEKHAFTAQYPEPGGRGVAVDLFPSGG